MTGKPKYNLNDEVTFKLQFEGELLTLTGKVYIVDAFGTFEQNEEPSYDIMVDDWRGTNEPMLVKHIRESGIINNGDN